MTMRLTNEQQELLRALHTMAPRWVVPLPKVLMPTMTQIAASWLVNITVQPGGGSGLVVGPAARMHQWYIAGWSELHVTNLKFVKMKLGTEPGDFRHGPVVFDLVPMSQAYRDELDAFLAVDAPFCLFFIEHEDEATLQWLQDKGFKLLKLNPKP